MLGWFKKKKKRPDLCQEITGFTINRQLQPALMTQGTIEAVCIRLYYCQQQFAAKPNQDALVTQFLASLSPTVVQPIHTRVQQGVCPEMPLYISL